VSSMDPLAVGLTGTHVIEASAGTGKTHAIGTLWLRLIVERHLPVDRILVVTFTRAATAELRMKLRARLRGALEALDLAAAGQATGAGGGLLDRLVARWRSEPGLDAACTRLRNALAELDQAAIHTIHGFCQRALQEHAFECRMPFDATFLEDDGPLIEEALADWWVTRLPDAPADVVDRFRSYYASPASLLSLARASTGIERPRLVGAGPMAQPAALDAATTARAAAWGLAADGWRADADGIGRILLDGPGLNRSKYRRGTVAQWLDALPGLFEGRPRALPGFAGKLTAGALAASTNKGHEAPRHPFFDACSALLAASGSWDEAVAGEAKALVFDCWEWLATEHAARKRARSVMAYDDLLGSLDRALCADGHGAPLAAALRARLPVALIDEFQDTDRVQYRIFRTLYAQPDAGTLLLIGDPKQAIYGFRGADIHAYRDAVVDGAPARWTLAHNWRSDAALVGAVNHVFSRHARPFLHAWIDFAAVAPRPGTVLAQRIRARDGAPVVPLEFLHFAPPDADEHRPAAKGDVERALPRAVAAEIGRLLAAGLSIGSDPPAPGALPEDGWRAVGPGDVAVLVRTNRQAAAMRRALQDLGIPNVLQSDHSVFETAEADDMARLLHAMANPTDAAAVRAALAAPPLGFDAAALDALGDDGRSWDAEGERFAAWHQDWLDGGFIRAFRRCLDQAQAPARLLARPGGERMLTNLLHLAELLHGASVERRLGPRGLIRWLARARAGDPGIAASASAQLRLERDAEAVQLVTVHRSKGLEYPIVFCPYAWGGVRKPGQSVTFRDAEAGDAPTLSLWPTDAHQAAAAREGLAEDLRLLYVALTRARHACRVVWGAFNGAESSALGYLLHPPDTPPGDDEAAWHAASAALAKAAVGGGPAAARRTLEARVDGSPAALPGGAPCIGLRDLPPGGGTAWRGARHEGAPLRALPLPAARRMAWRTSSFTGMARGDVARAIAGLERDHDALGHGDPEADIAGGVAASAPGHPLWDAAVPLVGFPAGARAGERVHSVLEALDFAAGDEAMDGAIARALTHREREDGWQAALEAAVRAALDTPLDGDGLKLRGLERRDRLAEVAFTLPVDAARDAPATAGALADALEAAPGPGLPSGYPERLRQLGFAPLSGFLSGYIDLAFRRDGRWYVLDWKSNRLGDRYRDYRRGALATAMAHHHYVLQYHLYALALHEHLRRRQPGYDYDAHFGGVFYLFLRGLHPDLGPSAGVFADRPPRVLVERLSTVLCGPAREDRPDA